MPLHTHLVGLTGATVSDPIEDRWTMNYAAAINDENPAYYDNENGTTVPTHPAYISHLEWDAISALHEKIENLRTDERLRGVHSFNLTTLEGSFQAGDEIACSASVVGIERRRSGGRMTIKTVTTCGGRAIATSFTSSVFRDVAVEGGPDVVPDIPRLKTPAPHPMPQRVEDIILGKLSTYHFSECARDYGAIHTDRNAAAKAGIPGLIMHGTGTIAYVLSSITNHEAAGDPRAIVGFQAKLGAMVWCPSTARLSVFADENTNNLVHFELTNEAGEKAISGGVVQFADRGPSISPRGNALKPEGNAP